jgi:putative tRNA adenosine deaminase-associated protein
MNAVEEDVADDEDEVEPAGDLDIFADFGMDAMELSAVCSDLELYPDEMLSQIAARIGFGPQFESVVDDDLS